MQRLSLYNTKEKLFLVASFILMLSICFVQLAEIVLHPTRIAAEAAMALDAGRQVCLGKLPYVNCFLLDEPIAIVVRALPAALSFLFHVHPIFLFSLSVLLLLIVSAGLLVALMRPASRRFGALNCTFFMVAYGLLAIIFRFEFGQNEHLFLLLFAPYVMARLVRSYGLEVNVKIAAVTGIFAVLAAGMATHCWLFLLMFEIYIFFDSKLMPRPLADGLYRNAPEIKALIVTSAIVCLCFLSICPSYFQDYLKLALADQNMFHFDLYYQTLSPDRRDVLYWFTFTFVLGTALRSSCELLVPLLVNCLTAFILYVVWQNGSSHSLIPLIAFVTLTLAVELGLVVGWFWKRFRQTKKELPLFQISALLLILGLAPAFLATAWQCAQVSWQDFKPLNAIGYVGYYNPEDMGSFADVIEKYSKPQDEVLVLNFWPRPAYPALLQLHREPASRYLCGSPIRILSQLNEERGNLFFHLLKGSEPKIFNNIANDVNANKPALVVIQDDALLSELSAAPLKGVLDKNYHLAFSRSSHESSGLDEAKFHPVELLGYSYGLSVYTHL